MGVGPGRHHDDRDRRLASDHPARLETIDPRKHQIDQDQFVGFCTEQSDGIFAIAHVVHVIALLFQR